MELTAQEVKTALAQHGRPNAAVFATRFFKTGPGQYGEGDQFIGVKVPDIRAVCRQFRGLPLAEIQALLDSPIHEHREAAVRLLAMRYPKASPAEQGDMFKLYLQNVYNGRVNNWDLVDVSAEHVIGAHEYNTDRKLLFKLAQSDNLWQKRVAIMSAFHYLKRGDPSTTLKLSEILLHDPHDLIQKAVGWQLRELGKRVDRQLLLDFLDKHAAVMPRTALRYAIEHLEAPAKRHYMQQKNQK
jgi:3-methyladenine DNA glycosylase AlkD